MILIWWPGFRPHARPRSATIDAFCKSLIDNKLHHGSCFDSAQHDPALPSARASTPRSMTLLNHPHKFTTQGIKVLFLQFSSWCPVFDFRRNFYINFVILSLSQVYFEYLSPFLPVYFLLTWLILHYLLHFR